MSWKQVAVTGLAVLGGFALLQYFRGQGGVLGAVLGTDRDLAIKRYLAGPRAVAESAKAAQMGADQYRDKKATEELKKS